jgi:hypothetical protein
MSYKKSLLTAREESNRRLGRPYKFRGAIVDLDNNDEALKLNVPDLRDGLMTSPNKNKKTTDKPLSFIDRTMDFIVASNDSLSKLVSENPMRGEVEDIIASFDKDAGLSDVLSGEGTSTRALTIDGEPVNMLDKGDDVNIKINPKSKEGISNFISSLSMSESSNDPTSRRTNTDGKEFGGELNFGMARLQDYMEDTGAEFDMDAFIDDPKLQKKVGLWHINSIDKEIAKIKNIPADISDQNGLRAVAHLGGLPGMKKFIASRMPDATGDVYNTKDELNTTLMSYYTKFSKKGV